MKLTIDNDKIGYIRLPNGVILQTVAGVINTIYTGVGGGVTYYVPKDATLVDISLSGVSGQSIYDGGLELKTINASNCALTAKSIGDILYAAYADNRANVNYNFTGGTSAGATAINAYLTITYGVGITLVAVKAALTGLGGTITNNP